MRQTTLCVPLEVKPESCSKLAALIEDLKAIADGGQQGENFRVVSERVPTLHFMSMSVFPATEYDPIFILEANFDGAPGPFWGQLEALFGAELRAIVRCCKKPLDEDRALYQAVTEPGSTSPVAAYLEARTQPPSVWHHGNRGLTRDRILGDHQLFLAVQQELDCPTRVDGQGAPAPIVGPSPYRAGAVQALHTNLRARLVGEFPWLEEPAPVRISRGERFGDYFRFFRFVVLALLALSAPGFILALLIGGTRLYLALVAVAAAIVFGWLYAKRKAIAGSEVINRVEVDWLKPKRLVLLALGIAIYTIAALVFLTPFVAAVHAVGWLAEAVDIAEQTGFGVLMRGAARAVLLGLLTAIVVIAPLLVLILRFNEMSDSSQDAPPLDDRLLHEILRREDWITQNHMASIVLIKPGALRSTILRAGHRGLGLLLLATATDGYLGSMRTVHFAHWAFLNNTSRLLFLSNFDHSWGSYLDDFIEKAHVGLTLAWGCGVGFPATRFLIYDGASHGRQFKSWALASRSVTRFWYSAYRDLTVDQIERNHRIANGLRKPGLNTEEAAGWALDL